MWLLLLIAALQPALVPAKGPNTILSVIIGVLLPSCGALVCLLSAESARRR